MKTETASMRYDHHPYAGVRSRTRLMTSNREDTRRMVPLPSELIMDLFILVSSIELRY